MSNNYQENRNNVSNDELWEFIFGLFIMVQEHNEKTNVCSCGQMSSCNLYEDMKRIPDHDQGDTLYSRMNEIFLKTIPKEQLPLDIDD